MLDLLGKNDKELSQRERRASATRRQLFLRVSAESCFPLVTTAWSHYYPINHKSSRRKPHSIEHDLAAEITFVRNVREEDILTPQRVEIVRAKRHPLIGVERLTPHCQVVTLIVKDRISRVECRTKPVWNVREHFIIAGV
jgi:hypothetical protein